MPNKQQSCSLKRKPKSTAVHSVKNYMPKQAEALGNIRESKEKLRRNISRVMEEYVELRISEWLLRLNLTQPKKVLSKGQIITLLENFSDNIKENFAGLMTKGAARK